MHYNAQSEEDLKKIYDRVMDHLFKQTVDDFSLYDRIL